MENTNRDHPAGGHPVEGRPTDGLDLWASEAPSGGAAALSVVRLEAGERPLIPFTTTMQRVRLHYLDAAAVRSYVHCLGDGCLLCRAGKEPETRDLLPVYDPVGQAVAVLAISPNLRAQALRPQLTPVLQRVRDGERLLLLLRRPDTTRFVVSAVPLPEDAEDGADHIDAFCKQLAAGAVSLDSVYPRLSAEDLAAIPEVARLLKLKGLQIP
jgi:hypothetical protein